ncbi:MAG TPA: PadR family transcriptional regulator [Dehalococcoidia bacterium]|nr:PadR family transcriptional regulator [Dehalococcoidia bacterium]
MSLRHALLGILSYRPMTGYELKQFFDASVQHFWNAELSQIYPTLKQLEEAGYVEKHLEVQENRPNRKVYEITPDGHEEFARWVREAARPADLRDPFLIKVFFGAELPAEDILIQLRRQLEEEQKMLAFSETVLRARIEHSGDEHKTTRRTQVFWSLTLEMAMAYRRAYINWCAHAMSVLESLGEQSEQAEEPAAAESA